MEGILAIIFLFGGGALVGISYSPVGKAVAARIRGDSAPPSGPDPEVLAEIDGLRHELSEVQERLDFAERLLAQREPKQLEEGAR
jgi:hypothetical protein